MEAGAVVSALAASRKPTPKLYYLVQPENREKCPVSLQQGWIETKAEGEGGKKGRLWLGFKIIK